MRKLLALSVFVLSLAASAQYNKFGVSYLGAGLGFGKMQARAQDHSPGYYSQGTFHARSNPLCMVSRFNHLGKGNKFGLGLYGGIDLGVANTKYKFTNTGVPGVTESEQKDFQVFIDLRLGIQAAYKIPEEEFLAGARYFYHAMGDGQRSYLTNNDESAALGIFAAWQRYGLELNHSSASIPGILIESNWNITELEFRYKLATWDEDNYSWLIGLRYEHSKWKPNDSGLPETSSNLMMLMFAFGTN